LASDPRRSVWVTANAGTGKTRVLTNRVLRLLLDGSDPESILCITFTKAAAAEMAARVERQLAEWAVAPDTFQLAADLEQLIGEAPADAVLDRARRLYAQVLDLPSGLGIMTIHSFCQSLLRRFPLEAGIAPHFELIDERTARELQIEARQQVLASKEPALVGAIEALAVLLGDESLTEAMAQLLDRRQHLVQLALAKGGVFGVIEAVHGLLEVEREDTEQTLIERACRAEEVDSRNLVPAANALLTGTPAQTANGLRILEWLNTAEGDRVRLFDRYRSTLLTQAGEPVKRLIPKALDEASANALLREQARLVRVEDSLRAQEVARRTAALLTVGYAVIDAYAETKRQAAALDFEDLISRSDMLLQGPDKRDWVRFKLDSRIDHLLVDEAQDTSPAQWSIIEHLVEEFHAGQGIERGARTLFVVGDEKQSIYSFQGADLASFAAVRERLMARFAAAGHPVERVVLDLSFRSGPAIVEAVDAVLADATIAAAVAGEESAAVRHQTFRQTALSHVEVWPLVTQPPRQARATDGWQLPSERFDADEVETHLAQQIAKQIRGWLDTGAVLEATGAPIRAGDILILLQRRGIAQERILKALKENEIPVAGADRLRLTDSIAVEDLIAMGQALLLPEDDLVLAALLKSPLLGLDEEALFRLAFDRHKKSLVERLRQLGERGLEPFAAAWRRFNGWLKMADFMPPFELFTQVLGSGGGRRRLLQRLGPDAAEPIDAFLAAALAYEEGHAASLQGFIHWLGLDAQQLKRDMEQGVDAVRVMTVHGAKGLEAPIVFLAEAGPYQPQEGRDRLLVDPRTSLPLWRIASAERDPVSRQIAESLKAREATERWRLLYVAMTRARDRLYVCGWEKRRGGSEGSWHDVIGRALDGLPDVEKEILDGRCRLVRGVAMSETQEALPTLGQAVPEPSWLRRPPVAEPAAMQLVQPSRDEALAQPASSPLAQGDGRLFGVALHRLLHEMAAVPEADRDQRFRTRVLAWPDLTEDDRSNLMRQVKGVFELSDLKPAFGPGSRAEQPIVGRIGSTVVAGQIDRLAVTPDAVYLVDFKSSRLPPADLADVPVAYLRQLAAYATLLGRIYPGRAIRAGLVWTAVPSLMAVPAALLDAHRPVAVVPA